VVVLAGGVVTGHGGRGVGQRASQKAFVSRQRGGVGWGGCRVQSVLLGGVVVGGGGVRSGWRCGAGGVGIGRWVGSKYMQRWERGLVAGRCDEGSIASLWGGAGR